MECNFNNQELKAAYEEVKVVLENPMYDITQVNADISQVEEILRNSKVVAFKIEPCERYNNEYTFYPKICWDGKYLYYDLTTFKPEFYVKDASDEYKFVCHKYLPKILREAKKKARKT